MGKKYFIAFSMYKVNGSERIDNAFFIPEKPINDIENVRDLEQSVLLERNQLIQSEEQKIIEVKVIAFSEIS